MIIQGSNIGIIKRDAGSLDESSHRLGVQGLHRRRSQTLSEMKRDKGGQLPRKPFRGSRIGTYDHHTVGPFTGKV